ncbi:MAG TPA: pseudouridine synthase [Chlamydiales bacterium]|nr:pseudouridine synthase [Chlamydiales bacterium]
MSTRLNKYLALCNICSRRKSEEFIANGDVKVNGHVVTNPATQIEDTDVVKFRNKTIKVEKKKLYFLLNKPIGYLCSNKRTSEKSKLAIDIFYAEKTRLFTIGRLDKNTSGLLLVTNDGDFANQVIHPSKDIEKEYLVKVREEISHEDLKKLTRRVRIENRWVKPVKVTKIRRGSFKIVIKEGLKHQVRIMTEYAGLTLMDLKRIRLGSLVLGNIPLGSYRSLTEKEINFFQ